MAKKNEKFTHKINSEIRSHQIRISGEPKTSIAEAFEKINPTSNVVVTLKEALVMAEDMGVDLVEISTTKDGISICKLIDYNKFIYELKKKNKDQEKRQKENAQEIKEIKFGPNIDEHDYNFKLKHAESFLERGDIVKATVFFKGREIQFKEKGEIILLRLATDLEEIGTPDNAKPRLEGKRMIMMIKPKKKK